MQWFVDETKARGYVVVATLVDDTDLTAIRRALQLTLPRGQRRIHMVDESDPLRRKFLGALVDAGLTARLYMAGADHGTDVRRRRACLRQVVLDAAATGCTRLVLESDPTQDARDRRTIIEARRETVPSVAFEYQHMRAYDEPLLWASDAVAWAFARGGVWRGLAWEVVAAECHV